jgi:septal ring factor EnvC (AmiA/AmiB activator)
MNSSHLTAALASSSAGNGDGAGDNRAVRPSAARRESSTRNAIASSLQSLTTSSSPKQKQDFWPVAGRSDRQRWFGHRRQPLGRRWDRA